MSRAPNLCHGTRPKKFELDDPVRVNGDGVWVYGRVIGFAGGGSIVCVRTPNGTEVQSGTAWVHKLTTEKELEALRQYPGYTDPARAKMLSSMDRISTLTGVPLPEFVRRELKKP